MSFLFAISYPSPASMALIMWCIRLWWEENSQREACNRHIIRDQPHSGCYRVQSLILPRVKTVLLFPSQSSPMDDLSIIDALWTPLVKINDLFLLCLFSHLPLSLDLQCVFVFLSVTIIYCMAYFIAFILFFTFIAHTLCMFT